jgi:hypothetical protein
MKCTVTHQGVPIGTVELPSSGDYFTVGVVPLGAYAAIQSLVRSASVALADVALGREANTVALQSAAALGRALELRDSSGAFVPVDFIELTEWPRGTPEIAAFIRLRQAHASLPAPLRPGRDGDPATAP